VCRYSDDPAPALRELVAKALVNMGVILGGWVGLGMRWPSTSGWCPATATTRGCAR
jgi:hypothetical protein